MRTFYVSVVVNTSLKAMDPEDRAVLGTYRTTVADDTLPLPAAVGGVLDTFHGQFGINVLDDVRISVHDETGAQVHEEDGVPSAGEGAADDLERVSRLPRPKKTAARRRQP